MVLDPAPRCCSALLLVGWTLTLNPTVCLNYICDIPSVVLSAISSWILLHTINYYIGYCECNFWIFYSWVGSMKISLWKFISCIHVRVVLQRGVHVAAAIAILWNFEGPFSSHSASLCLVSCDPWSSPLLLMRLVYAAIDDSIHNFTGYLGNYCEHLW